MLQQSGFPLFSKYQILGFFKVFGPKFQVFGANVDNAHMTDVNQIFFENDILKNES